MLKFLNIKINFKGSFFILMLIMTILKLQILFIVLFLSVFVHELAHILSAFSFGVSCEKIIVSPIGQIAVLNGFEEISWIKRLIVIFAGPFINFIIFIILRFSDKEIFNFIAFVNLAIGVFNLVPAYPLDGGRILKAVLCRFIGILNANKAVFKVSFVMSHILFFLGFIQVILFPYNISILCISVYLIKIIKKERIKLTLDFYKIIMGKKNNNLKNKVIKADINGSVTSILNKLSFDYNLIIKLYDKKKYIIDVDEKTILNKILKS